MKDLVIVTATGKEKKMDAGVIYAFVLLFRLGSEARKVLTTFGLGIPTYINSSWKSDHRHTERCVSWVI